MLPPARIESLEQSLSGSTGSKIDTGFVQSLAKFFFVWFGFLVFKWAQRIGKCSIWLEKLKKNLPSLKYVNALQRTSLIEPEAEVSKLCFLKAHTDYNSTMMTENLICKPKKHPCEQFEVLLLLFPLTKPAGWGSSQLEVTAKDTMRRHTKKKSPCRANTFFSPPEATPCHVKMMLVSAALAL